MKKGLIFKWFNPRIEILLHISGLMQVQKPMNGYHIFNSLKPEYKTKIAKQLFIAFALL